MGLAADDAHLLDRYARTRDEAAFAEVMRRHLDMVYAAAVRRVGDRHLAEDVSQAVFVILARRAGAAARGGGPLSGWLLRTVRYAAANAVKAERRRRRHEAAAAAGRDACSHNPADVLVWREVAARLDDAVLRLPLADRRAVLLRYFERRPVRDVAAALGTTEAAAKQRLSRSVAKLRDRLDRDGACLGFAGTAGLAPLLAANAVRAAPPALAAAATSTSAAAGGPAALAIAKGAMTMMGATNAKLVAAAVAATVIVGAGVAVTASRGNAPPANVPPAAAAAAPMASPAAGPTLRARAEARAKAADAIVAAVDKHTALGEPITPALVLTKATAQRAAVDARIDAAAGDPAAQLRAAEQYLTECRRTAGVLKERFEKGLDGTRITALQADQQVAEAEYLLDKLKAAK